MKLFIKNLFICILSIAILMIASVFAEVDTSNNVINFKKVNKKVLKYVEKAQKESNYEKQEEYLIKATKKIKIKSKDDIILKAALYYLTANAAKENKKNDIALSWYKKSCDYLEENNLIKNNYLAFGCLMNILNIAKSSKDYKLYNQTLLKIEETQMGLADKLPREFFILYGKLFEYYNNTGNTAKALKYEKKIKANNN